MSKSITEQPWYARYQVDVPEGQQGAWRVERFEVTKNDAEFAAIRSMFSGARGAVPQGEYTRLIRLNRSHFDGPMMSDTPDEISDHRQAIQRTREGHRCLINGLGLGMVTAAMLNRGAQHVTVIEIEPDIVGLVGPHLQKRYGDRLSIELGDAFTWKPPKGARYHVVWHDIWKHICLDNLEGMKRLHRRFGRYTDWQGSWSRPTLERLRRSSR